MNDQKLTGYPSIDKPWLKYYKNTENSVLDKMKKMDYIRSKKIDSNFIALEYFGKKVTYGELDKTIVEYAKKLETLGVKENDSVAICMPNTIESAELTLAINEKAAICNNIFPLSKSNEIKYCLNMLNSEIIFVLDSILDELNKIIDETNLKKVFVLTPFESHPIINFAYKTISHKKENKNNNIEYYSFKDFLKTPPTDYKKNAYKENRLSSVQYTSGTTGLPKAVALTDDCFNARAFQYEQINVGLESGLRFLQCLPYCGKAYGEFTMHIGLCNGCCNVLVPKFSSSNLLKLIRKHNIQGLTMPPIAWLHVIDMPEFKKTDFSNFKLATVGGDGSIEKYIKMIQNALEKQGFKGQVILGSGGTELGVTFSTNTNDINIHGSSGPILFGNNCVIKKDNGDECKYNEMGTIYYNPISPSLGYLNDYEYVFTDDGIDLGDYGFIDEKGALTVAGRKKDIININGELLSPMCLEIEINKCPYVKYGYVVSPKNSEKKIRICYTTYDKKKANYDIEVLKFIDSKYHQYTEIKNLVYIPETVGLKVDRKRLSGNIDDLLVN